LEFLCIHFAAHYFYLSIRLLKMNSYTIIFTGSVRVDQNNRLWRVFDGYLYRIFNHLQPLDPSVLTLRPLTFCGALNIAITMTARLEPLIQFFMEGAQGMNACMVYYPG
jgi:hypothetical protein